MKLIIEEPFSDLVPIKLFLEMSNFLQFLLKNLQGRTKLKNWLKPMSFMSFLIEANSPL
jgi:hypothetical protein